jgi:hypothetical protein
MLGAYLSILKQERAEKQRAIELMEGGAERSSEGVVARFRQQLAELDALVARVEARSR